MAYLNTNHAFGKVKLRIAGLPADLNESNHRLRDLSDSYTEARERRYEPAVVRR